MHRISPRIPIAALACAALAPQAIAQLTVEHSFSLGGSTVAVAYDRTTDTLWSYSGGLVRSFASDGTPLGTLSPPESGNDLDLEIAPVDLTLAGVPVPKGTLLFIAGESGPAEIYAMDSGGSVIAVLPTAFGVSHVVGGAYHPGRDTFFLVQDHVPGTASEKNLIAEVDPATGAVLATFMTTDADPAFTVNYGDLDVAPVTGNLLVVSSDESSILELSPTGALISTIPLPAGPSSLAGLAIADEGDEAWVCSNGATVWRLSGLPPFWASLGGETPIASGPALLRIAGALTPGSPLAIELVDAPPGAVLVLGVSKTSTPVPIFGGTLHAFPPILQAPGAASAAGTFTYATAWGSAVPSGTPFYAQFVVVDPSLPGLIALSNAVTKIVP